MPSSPPSRIPREPNGCKSSPVAIITGSASGIGLALTKHLLSRSYKVFCADNSQDAPSIISSLNPAPGGPAPSFIHTDVSSFANQAALFKEAWSYNHSIDLFAANAGITDKENVFQEWEDKYGEEESEESDEPKEMNMKTIEVDLLAVFQGLKLFVYYARRSKRINPQQHEEGKKRKMVITSSMMGIYPFETSPQYCAAKHGLIGLVRSVGPKFAQENINVNAILPAFVSTGLAPAYIIDAVEDAGHLTPVSSIIKAYDSLIQASGDNLAGQTVEVSGEQLYWRTPVDYANESQKFLTEDPEEVWKGGSKRARMVAKERNGTC